MMYLAFSYTVGEGAICISLTVHSFPNAGLSLACVDLNPNQSFFSFFVLGKEGRFFKWTDHSACFFVGMSPPLAEDFTRKPGKQRTGINYTNEFTQIWASYSHPTQIQSHSQVFISLHLFPILSHCWCTFVLPPTFSQEYAEALH